MTSTREGVPMHLSSAKPRVRRLRWPAALVACGLLAPPAIAQSPGDLTGLPLEQLMAIDVVYGASKHEQKITDAPSFVSVVTADDIERYGYRTLADVLRSVHGFYTTYDRTYTYLGIRGFSRPSDYNSRFLLLVDGHRVNDNFYGTAYISTEAVVDIEQVDRVEIIRGPNSSLYGTSAFFAVINVVTKKQSAVPRGEVSGGVASYGTPSARLAFAKAFEGGFSLQGAISGYKSAGQDLFYSEYDDPLTNDGVFENGDDDRVYRLFSTATLGHWTIQAAASSREKGMPTGAFDTPFNDTNARTLDERAYLDFKYENALSQRTSMLTRLSFDHYYYRGDYPYYTTPPATALYREHAWGDWVSAEAKLITALSPRQTLTAGLEYRDNLRQKFQWQNVYPGPLDFDDSKHSAEGGVYVQDEIAATKNASFNLGLRHDQYETFGGSTNPRAAFVYHPWAQTTMKMLIGRAFRAPYVYELYYGSHANPDLRPESISTYEAVFEQYARGNLRFAGSAYLYDTDDLVSVNTSTNTFENLARVRAQGVELEFEKRFRSGFNLRASTTVQEAKDETTDQTLTNSPRTLGRLNMDFPLRGERLSAGVEVQYTSRRLTVNDTYAPGYTIANLTLLSRQVAHGLTLSASVYNVFDTRYADPASGNFVQDTIEQDGRNFRFMMTWGF